MRLLAIWIERSFGVPVESPHAPDASKHRRTVALRNEDHGFRRRLPFQYGMLSAGQLGDVGRGGV
jgi:hypothetical protein